MRLFADTANLSEISYCFSKGVNDGITTNPNVIEQTADLANGFEEACRSILKAFPNVPVNLEIDLQGINIKTIESDPEKVKDVFLKQAYNLSKMSENVVVKIPICSGGLLAVKELTKYGIKTNVTACMTPYQALSAAKNGALYVSLFANRMLDSNVLELAGYNLEKILLSHNWKDILKKSKSKWENEAWNKTLREINYVSRRLEKSESSLIVGSIRSSDDINKIAKANPQIITIPAKIVKELNKIIEIKNEGYASHIEKCGTLGFSIIHPMTLYTISEFQVAANSYKSK